MRVNPVARLLVDRTFELSQYRNNEYNYLLNSPLRTFKSEIFQALAHPTRIAVVEALRHGEMNAGALLSYVAVEPANLSQHLAILRSKQVVLSRKAGNQVFYTLRDPVLIEVLDLLKRYFNAQLQQSAAMLDQLHADPDRRT